MKDTVGAHIPAGTLQAPTSLHDGRTATFGVFDGPSLRQTPSTHQTAETMKRRIIRLHVILYHQGVVSQKSAALDGLNIVGIKPFLSFGVLCWNQWFWLILTVTVTEMLLGFAAWESDTLGVSRAAGSRSGKGNDWVTPCSFERSLCWFPLVSLIAFSLQ